MKKLIFLILMLPLLAVAQRPIPPNGHTYIAARYDWLGGQLEAITIPAFNGVPILKPLQFTGAGALGVDSLNDRFYFYSHGGFIRVANFSEVTAGGTLNIDTTYNRLATRFSPSLATLKSLKIVQGSPVTPIETDSTIEFDIGGADGNGIYSGSGSLPSLVGVNLNGHQFSFSSAIDTLFRINPNTFHSFMQARDGTATTFLDMYANSAGVNENFVLQTANGGCCSASITGDGTTGKMTLYPSDSLYFKTTLPGASSGYVWKLADPTTGSGYWASAGGGGGSTLANFYLKDSSLSSDRTVDLNGHTISFENGGRPFIELNPSALESVLSADDGAGTSSTISVRAQVDDVVNFSITASNFGGSSIGVTGDAVANSIAYTANIHTFTGNVVLNSTASGSTTDSILIENPSTHVVGWRDASNFTNSGTVTSIATSNGIAGGTITTAGTISGINAVADGSTIGVATYTASDFNDASGVISLDYTNGQKASASVPGFLSSTDWNTFNNKQPAGSYLTIGISNYAHNISTPTTGGTVNLTGNQYNIINPSGALLALTLNLPSSPANNDVVYIKFTQNITTVTYGNGTVVDGITAPTAGGLTILVFNSGDTKWY